MQVNIPYMDGIGSHSSSSMGKAKGYGYLAPHTSSSSTSLGKMVRPDPAAVLNLLTSFWCVFFGLLFLQQDNIKNVQLLLIMCSVFYLFFLGVSFVVLCSFCCLCFSTIVLFVAQLDVFF